MKPSIDQVNSAKDPQKGFMRRSDEGQSSVNKNYRKKYEAGQGRWKFMLESPIS